MAGKSLGVSDGKNVFDALASFIGRLASLCLGVDAANERVGIYRNVIDAGEAAGNAFGLVVAALADLTWMERDGNEEVDVGKVALALQLPGGQSADVDG